MKSLIIILVFCFGSSLYAKPLALIYNGKGVCGYSWWDRTYNCAEAAADVARAMGYVVKFVDHKETDPAIFKNAKIWFQPGGEAKKQVKKINRTLKANIKSFVNRGGVYVGFCAGMFLAADKFSWTGFSAEGLGLIPQEARLYRLKNLKSDTIIKILERDETRNYYWRLGPLVKANQINLNTLIDYTFYPKNSLKCKGEKSCLASIVKNVGMGKIILTGFHPEAHHSWLDSDHNDVDGSDVNYFAQKILKYLK